MKIRYFGVLKKVFENPILGKKVLHTQKLCVEEKISKKDFFGFFKPIFGLKNDFRKRKNLEFKFNLEKIEKKSQNISFYLNISLFEI